MTTDLDLPLLPSAEQIRRREFASVRRGYDPDQVRDFLFQVAEQVKALEGELAEAKLKAESEAAAPEAATEAQPEREDPYERVAQRFKEVISSADQEAERIVAEAGEQAEDMLGSARADADRIKVDAQAHAEEARQRGSEFLTKAKAESERVLNGLAARRRDLARQIEDMHGKLLAAARNLEFALGEGEDEPGDPAGADHVERYEDMLEGADLDADLPSLNIDFEDDAPSDDPAG
jgi:DivIVA domain-containing protein